MRLGLLAKKIGMSRFYDSLGINHPVTILKVDESNVVDIKTNEKNGYSAVRLSLGKSKRNNNKPVKGFLKKQNIPAFLFSKEFRVSETDNYKVGEKVSVNNFIEGWGCQTEDSPYREVEFRARRLRVIALLVRVA